MSEIVIVLLKEISNMISILDDNNSIEYTKKNIMTRIKDTFFSMSEEEKNDFFTYIENEFKDDYSLFYILSIMIRSTQSDTVYKKAIEYLIESNFSIYEKMGIYYQIRGNIFTYQNLDMYYQELRKLHLHNTKLFYEELRKSYEYIPYSKRNKNKIVIVAEQILGIKHSPSKIILDYCHTLQSVLGMEILLIITPITEVDDYIWIDPGLDNHMSYLNGDYVVRYESDEISATKHDLMGQSVIVYKDTPIMVKQVPFIKGNDNQLKRLMDIIYVYNPLYVLDTGNITPIANVCNYFTTVVGMGMSYSYPISDASILIKFDKNANDTSIKPFPYNKQQIVIDTPFTYSLDKATNPCQKKDYGVSDTSFLIGIVGNRLKAEITNEFLGLLKRIFMESDEIHILLIGEYPEYEEVFSDSIFKDRILYLGYQNSLIDVISIADLYLNPPRSGGGISALVALSAGVPVITLPEGDVAGNVKQDFICNDEDEIINCILRYKNDREFYEEQQSKGFAVIDRLTDLTGNISRQERAIEKIIVEQEGLLENEN